MRYLAAFLTFVGFSCETNWGKFGGYKIEYDSAMEYYLVLDQGEAIYATDSEKQQSKKGILVSYYRYSGAIDTFRLGKGSKIIESFVDADNVTFDDTFILVDQKPLNSICECNQECLSKKYEDWNNLPTYKLCEDALKKSTFHRYWIINKKINAVYGPLKKEEYLKQREFLGIPEDLTIKIM